MSFSLERWALMSFGCFSTGCALGSSPLLHHPNQAGNFDGYVGYSLPVQPATARIVATPSALTTAAPSTHNLRSNTGFIVPEIYPGYIAYVADPKVYGSVGLTDRVVNCRDCEAKVTFEEFKQDFGVELQVGMRY